MNKKLWIVTFYNAESEKDWEIVVAKSFDVAIKTARSVIRDQCGLNKWERIECSDFDAFIIDDECDINGKNYNVILEERK